MMLSGFFGLMAMETSAGLMAVGSMMRMTCWAVASLSPENRKPNANASKSLIFVSLLNDCCKSCNSVDTKKQHSFLSISFWREIMAEASESKVTTNHDEIRRWVEERGGHPAR